MGWFRNMIAKIFKIIPATEREIQIKEPLTFNENVLKTRSGIGQIRPRSNSSSSR